VVGYSFPDGGCAAYYPETNPLVPLYARDPLSFTPSAKGVPIRIVRAGASDESDSAVEGRGHSLDGAVPLKKQAALFEIQLDRMVVQWWTKDSRIEPHGAVK
jgi:hypothetical protein